MKKLSPTFTLLVVLCIFSFSCEKALFEEDIQTGDPFVNFDYLWEECWHKYSFFEHKGVDWPLVKETYRPALYYGMDEDSLFAVMSAMLMELRDDHTNLRSPFNVFAYRNYMSGPRNFDWRLLMDHYLPRDYHTTGPFRHAFLSGDSIGYIYLPGFQGDVSNATLDFLMNRYANTQGLILDIRQNSGGSISYVYRILSRFIDKETLLYYSRIKSGPGREEFSALEPVSLKPSENTRYTGKVVVLADRGSYSASSFMALGVRSIPNATLMGDTTGGGLGLPSSGQLPNGWTFRFSITQTLDQNHNNYEDGVPPEVNAYIDWNNPNKDEVLEKAMEEIRNKP